MRVGISGSRVSLPSFQLEEDCSTGEEAQKEVSHETPVSIKGLI
jgi:hypothetical protein